MACPTGIVLLSILIFIAPAWCMSKESNAEHVTAILGESVVLNCPVSLPNTSIIIQLKKEADLNTNLKIYTWYESYDPYVEDSYKGRVSRVLAENSYDLASLQLTDIREADQGWYVCKVIYLDRRSHTDNDTWVHLDVHAAPRFTTVLDPITYVNLGDSIILNCEAEGAPKPEIIWFRDDEVVQNSEHMDIIKDGTELQINKILDEDIGDYVCVALNAEGRKHHETKVVISAASLIVTPPHNQTIQEGEKVEFPCETRALPGNVTVQWKREGIEIDQLGWLDSRTVKHKNGTLIINPTIADDVGFFTCEVSIGIGATQRATSYLNVEYPAQVSYTPTVQYLPLQHQGIIKCFIKSNPDIQFVTWIKDKRLFDPFDEEGVIQLKNGSLLITHVTPKHQGMYSCTPYNRHTTEGSSGDMEILVREHPKIQPRPQQQYHGNLGEEVVFHCGGIGTPPPEINWRRRDGQNLPRDRIVIDGGNLTIRKLRKADHAFYECVVSNEITTLVTATELLVEGTTPHAPYNISSEVTDFSVKLSWQPGYPGGNNFEQNYTIWYRVLGTRTWSTIDIKQQGSTDVTVYKLLPDTTYEFELKGYNELGYGTLSDIITATTLGLPVVLPRGPRLQPPHNVTVKINNDCTISISWLPPEDTEVPVVYYDIEYKNEGSWKKLNVLRIVDTTSYTAKNLNPGKKYTIRVFSKTLTSFQASSEVEFVAPMINKDKAITAELLKWLPIFCSRNQSLCIYV